MEHHDNSSNPKKYTIDEARNIAELPSESHSRQRDSDTTGTSQFAGIPNSQKFMEFPNMPHYEHMGSDTSNHISIQDMSSRASNDHFRSLADAQKPPVVLSTKEPQELERSFHQDLHFQQPNFSQYAYDSDDFNNTYSSRLERRVSPMEASFTLATDSSRRSRFDAPNYQLSSNYQYPPQINSSYTYSDQGFDDSVVYGGSQGGLYRHRQTGSYNPPLSHRAQQSSLGNIELVNSHQRMLSTNRVDELEHTTLQSPSLYQMNLFEFSNERATDLQQYHPRDHIIPLNTETHPSNYQSHHSNMINFIPQNYWDFDHTPYQSRVPQLKTQDIKESNPHFIANDINEIKQYHQNFGHNFNNNPRQMLRDQTKPNINEDLLDYSLSKGAQHSATIHNPTHTSLSTGRDAAKRRGHIRSGSISKEPSSSHRRSKSSLRHLPISEHAEFPNLNTEMQRGDNDILELPSKRGTTNISSQNLGRSKPDNTTAKTVHEMKRQKAHPKKQFRGKIQREPILLAAKNPMHDFRLQNQQHGLGIDIDNLPQVGVKNSIDELGKDGGKQGHSSGLTPLLFGESPQVGSQEFSSDYSGVVRTSEHAKIMDPWVYSNEWLNTPPRYDSHNNMIHGIHSPAAGPSNSQDLRTQEPRHGLQSNDKIDRSQGFMQRKDTEADANPSGISRHEDALRADPFMMPSANSPLISSPFFDSQNTRNFIPTRLNIPFESRITQNPNVPQETDSNLSIDNNVSRMSQNKYQINEAESAQNFITPDHLYRKSNQNLYDLHAPENIISGEANKVKMSGKDNESSSRKSSEKTLFSVTQNAREELSEIPENSMKMKRAKSLGEQFHDKEFKSSRNFKNEQGGRSSIRRTSAGSGNIRDLISESSSSVIPPREVSQLDIEAEVPDKSQFSKESRNFKWSQKERKELFKLLDAGERHKWKYVSEQVSHSLGKRIPVRACKTKFEALFGTAENSSRLGSSLFYMAYRSGWLTVKNKKTEDEASELNSNDQITTDPSYVDNAGNDAASSTIAEVQPNHSHSDTQKIQAVNPREVQKNSSMEVDSFQGSSHPQAKYDSIGESNISGRPRMNNPKMPRRHGYTDRNAANHNPYSDIDGED